ncbi:MULTISPECIES: hypothetical protein [Saliphagus]|uniref:Uncharacterized protein n=1 Tax=Saliphagus infecundisoli TaxID=1849069 RepID=A0ABD5QKP5_9EURY|nr:MULTISPECIES: hypothetical protein [Saliphagus]
MNSQPRPSRSTYRCPDCEGDLAATDGTWRCRDCGYVPNHGAD